MTIKVRAFDAAEYLHDEASKRAFLDESADSNDPSFIDRAINVFARAKGDRFEHLPEEEKELTAV
jgi:DNA-binding phage protein